MANPLTKLIDRFRADTATVGAEALSKMANVVTIDDAFRTASTGIFQDLTRDYASSLKIGYARNCAVFACLSKYAIAYPSIRLQVYDEETDAPVTPDDPRYRIQRALDRPTPELSGSELARFKVVYKALGGTIYLKKLRNLADEVVGFQPFSELDVEPVLYKKGDNVTDGSWIKEYEFRPHTTDREIWRKEDVIMLTWPSINPGNPLKGLSPIQVAALEIGADSEATRYRHTLLKNDAMPRTLIMTHPDARVDPEQRQAFKEKFRQQYGAGQRGEPMVLAGGSKVERLSPNLDELAFDALGAVSDVRICQVMGVPPQVAGIKAGIDKSTYSNYESARLSFAEESLIPLRQNDAEEMTNNLKPDFAASLGRDDWYIGIDASQLPAIRNREEEATQSHWKRVTTAYKVGILDRATALEELGYDPATVGDDTGNDKPSNTPNDNAE